MNAKGTFDVKVSHEPVLQLAEGEVGQFRATKVFSGDLQGTSTVWMLTGGDQKAGHAGYAAMEVFKGSVHGKIGTFMLQHQATMSPGGFDMRIVVTPGSGTGALAGINGTFKIDIVEKAHHYALDYSL